METTEELELRTRLRAAAEAAPPGDVSSAVHAAQRARQARRRKLAAVVASGAAMVSVTGVVATTGLVTGWGEPRGSERLSASSVSDHRKSRAEVEHLLRKLRSGLKEFDIVVGTHQDVCTSDIVLVTAPGKARSAAFVPTVRRILRAEKAAGRFSPDAVALQWAVPLYQGEGTPKTSKLSSRPTSDPVVVPYVVADQRSARMVSARPGDPDRIVQPYPGPSLVRDGKKMVWTCAKPQVVHPSRD